MSRIESRKYSTFGRAGLYDLEVYHPPVLSTVRTAARGVRALRSSRGERSERASEVGWGSRRSRVEQIASPRSYRRTNEPDASRVATKQSCLLRTVRNVSYRRLRVMAAHRTNIEYIYTRAYLPTYLPTRPREEDGCFEVTRASFSRVLRESRNQ